MSEPEVVVVGGGPAGAVAALSALNEGARVTLYEKSSFPRHKVCGEFLSPEFGKVLDRLGAWDRLRESGAATIRRMSLWIGNRERCHQLNEPAYGLSRHRMDTVLLAEIAERGAVVLREKLATPPQHCVWAAGRKALPEGEKGERLFGFKAHFEGPGLDEVGLHFFEGCYVGVSSIEDGLTNVCGLGPLHLLHKYSMQPDGLLELSPALRERIAPLRRRTRWFHTGPLCFGYAPSISTVRDIYPAGDAMAFVDPFTGAGMTIAAITGNLAGIAASRRDPPQRLRLRSEQVLRRTLNVASLLRTILGTGWAEPLSALSPAGLLFRATRPRLILGVG